ncbi:hypothetical protein KDL01_02285 [Actinospica durhamensis]|uniref:Uncharacterized protein n=1 Tax=Actinospica durhamensis TaxID=1508375 RepID=A0A941EIE1_9ACTN|nr:hypothetical protein [Actinospica durhamensis]MBR7832067.1 hypothetical protein [Actinospica durhamensis]
MTASVELPPVEIPGYAGGPFIHRPRLLDEHLFVIGHPYGCVQSEQAEEAVFGTDYEEAANLNSELLQGGHWPVFTVPLTDRHRLYVVYRAFPDDPGVDYLLHHPDWEQAEMLAADDGHFHGPGLRWHELEATAFNALPGGSTQDPHARLLLLLPALGDDLLDKTAVDSVVQALAARTRVDDPERAATLLLDEQGQAGPAHWQADDRGTWTCDGSYAFRAPGGLPPARLARISAALNPW